MGCPRRHIGLSGVGGQSTGALTGTGRSGGDVVCQRGTRSLACLGRLAWLVCLPGPLLLPHSVAAHVAAVLARWGRRPSSPAGGPLGRNTMYHDNDVLLFISRLHTCCIVDYNIVLSRRFVYLDNNMYRSVREDPTLATIYRYISTRYCNNC